jgi:hypothetical protein
VPLDHRAGDDERGQQRRHGEAQRAVEKLGTTLASNSGAKWPG